MTAPLHEGPSDSLKAIRDDLHRRETEGKRHADQSSRRQGLMERLGSEIVALVTIAGSQLARDDRFQDETYFADLARHVLTFNEMLREADLEYTKYRIIERLRRAARAEVPALDTAASLLLLDQSTAVGELAKDLERIQKSQPHDVWPMWLTYILDQLFNSNKPPLKDTVPPDTTRAEWRKAEIAFGCILFTDSSFGVMQESVDRANGLIDDAMKCGKYPGLKRPPGRVRDLIGLLDPRALHWFGLDPTPVLMLKPPPSIEAITDPQQVRRKLDEVWTAANCLQIALDKWADWFVHLNEKGDAQPAIALNCDEFARKAIHVLVTNRPTVEPFLSSDQDSLLSMLPPIPSWWIGEKEKDPKNQQLQEIGGHHVRWQEDREFLDQYYAPPERRHDKAVELRGAATKLISLLESFPMTAIADQSSSTTNSRIDNSAAEEILLRAREARQREAEKQKHETEEAAKEKRLRDAGFAVRSCTMLGEKKSNNGSIAGLG